VAQLSIGVERPDPKPSARRADLCGRDLLSALFRSAHPQREDRSGSRRSCASAPSRARPSTVRKSARGRALRSRPFIGVRSPSSTGTWIQITISLSIVPFQRNVDTRSGQAIALRAGSDPLSIPCHRTCVRAARLRRECARHAGSEPPAHRLSSPRSCSRLPLALDRHFLQNQCTKQQISGSL
jgi:hypothetical protein